MECQNVFSIVKAHLYTHRPLGGHRPEGDAWPEPWWGGPTVSETSFEPVQPQGRLGGLPGGL